MLAGLLLLSSVLVVSGRICVDDACQEVALEGDRAIVAIAPAEVERTYAWVANDGSRAVLGRVAAGARAIEVGATSELTVRALSDGHSSLPPIAVSVRDAEDGNEWTVHVRPDGREHELHLILSPGRHTVLITAEDRSVRPAGRVEAVASADTPVELPPWQLVPRLAGLVRSAAGEPVEGAEIEEESGELLTMSAFDGRFQIDEPAPGANRLLIVRAAGYGSQHVFVPPDADEVGVIELHEGATLQLVVSHPTAVEPIPITVRVRPGNRDAPGSLFRGEGRTDERMQITDLPRGRHMLYVDGPEPLQRFARTLEVVGADIELDVLLEPVSLDGSVRYGSEPLAGAKVELRGDPQWEASITANDEGRFGGEMWDRGDLFGFVTAKEIDRPYFFGDRGPSGDHRIVDLRIPATVLEGRVESAGRAVPGAKVAIATRSGEVEGTTSARSDETGRFEVRGLSEGSHTVTVTADGYLRAEVAFETTAADESRKLTIELQRGREVTVVVTGASGAPVAGAQIWAGVRADGMSSERMLIAGSDGRAPVTMDPAVATQIVISDPSGGGFAVARLEPGGPDELHVTVAAESGELSVRVVDGDGAPVGGVGLLVRYQGLVIPPLVLANILGQRRVPVATADDGTMRLPALPAGRYELFPLGAGVGVAELVASHATRAPSADVIVDGRSAVAVTVRFDKKPPEQRQLVVAASGSGGS